MGLDGNVQASRGVCRLVFFAGLWSAIEVSLVTILSLSKIPFRGLLLASIGCFFIVSFRYIVDKPRVSIYLASIVAVVKLIFSLGAGGFNSAVAIFLEGLIAEIIFSVLKANLISSSLVGGGVVVYPFFHSLVTQTLIFGVDIFRIYNKILGEIQLLFGKTNKFTIFELIIIFALIYFLVGCVVGLLSFYFAKKVVKPILEPKTDNESG
jgi:hypothetical protein